jgi:hypothetical protein
MANGPYSGWNQDKASVSSQNLGEVLNNYSFGGINGFGLVLIEAAQFVLLTENLNTAQNYFDTNKKDFDFFTSTYEGKMSLSLSEAMQRPLYEAGFFSPQYGKLDYLSNTGRGASAGARILDKKWYATRRRVQKYQVGLGRWVDYKFAMGKVNETLNGWNLGWRYEDHRKEQYDEQRHAHRIEILNLGIGVGNAARKGLATAVGQLSEARTQAASQAASIGNGLASSSSYQGTKEGLQKLSPSRLATDTSAVQGKYISGSDIGDRLNVQKMNQTAGAN